MRRKKQKQNRLPEVDSGTLEASAENTPEPMTVDEPEPPGVCYFVYYDFKQLHLIFSIFCRPQSNWNPKNPKTFTFL